jgi:hypothetical protein
MLSLGAGVAAADTCANAQFRTGLSTDLPNCRAFEQVSSVDKHGNSIVSFIGGRLNPAFAAPDGSALMFTSGQGPTAEHGARGMGFPEVAERSASGWITRPAINGPAPQAVIDAVSALARYQLPSSDRRSVLFTSGSPFVVDQPYVLSGRNGGVYLGRGDAVDWVSRPTSPNSSPANGTQDLDMTRFFPVGGSPDLSTSYFASTATLTPQDDASGRTPLANWAVYRWTDGHLANAGVLPDGSVDPDGSAPAGLAMGTWPAGNSNAAVLSAQYKYANTVSADGKGLLFVSPDPASGSSRPPQLYLARTGQQTVRLSRWSGAGSAPAGGTDVGVAGTGAIADTGQLVIVPAGRGVYAVATPDQQTVLFSTTDALTDDASTDASTYKTYRYDAADGGSLTHLTELDRPTVTNRPGGTGTSSYPIYNMSDDGSRILYRDYTGNLKLWRHGQSTITLASGLGEWTDGISNSRFSSDGHTLVLMSKVPLRGAADHPAGGGPQNTEVYRYTEDDDALSCISCAPGITMGPATFVMLGIDNGFGEMSEALALPSPKGMSDDGKIVFFTTTSALSSDDHNTAADVYQWKDGATHLLSSGTTGSYGDFLLDNSASGDDVFIVSRQALTVSDTDDVYDAYDVRVGGGFAPPAEALVPCQGDACQGAASGSAIPAPSVASVTFAGAGNLTPAVDEPATTGKAKVSVSGKAVRGTRFTVTVKVPGKGRITASGASVRSVKRTATRAATYRVSVALTAKAARTLRKKGTLKVAVRVGYAPSSGNSSSTTVHVTLKRPGTTKGR